MGFQGEGRRSAIFAIDPVERQYWNNKEDGANKAVNWNVIDDVTFPTTKLVHDALGSLGIGGSSVTFAATAGEAIGGQRAVRLASSQVYYANSSTPSHASVTVGLTTGAVASGAEATVMTAGLMTDSSFSFTPGQAVYLNGNGTLSQSPPSSGFILQVGVAMSATSILIDIKQPILI